MGELWMPVVLTVLGEILFRILVTNMNSLINSTRELQEIRFDKLDSTLILWRVTQYNYCEISLTTNSEHVGHLYRLKTDNISHRSASNCHYILFPFPFPCHKADNSNHPLSTTPSPCQQVHNSNTHRNSPRTHSLHDSPYHYPEERIIIIQCYITTNNYYIPHFREITFLPLPFRPPYLGASPKSDSEFLTTQSRSTMKNETNIDDEKENIIARVNTLRGRSRQPPNLARALDTPAWTYPKA